MNNRNSEIILCKNIKLDKNYNNVLNYTESQMVDLCRANQVANSNNFSFIRKGVNVIDTNFTYNQGLQANYIAFQNPSYSNKWFFAFVDEIEYISNGCARIYYTIDEHSTWFSLLTVKSCLVLREHVNSDNPGENTVPEGLDTGEYVNVLKQENNYDNDFYICFGVTKLLLSGKISANSVYNGVFSGLLYIIAENNLSAGLIIEQYSLKGMLENIVNVFYIPKKNVEITSGGWIALEDYPGYHWALIKASNDPVNFGTLTFNKPTKLDVNYIPKNKKLLTYPYCYALLDNNVGGTAILMYEYFFNPTEGLENVCDVVIWGTIGAGCSIKAVPYHYKQISPNYEEGLTLGKLPICSWSGDTYTNYLTQQSINNSVKIGGIGAKIATEDYLGAFKESTNMISDLYQRSLAPYQISGNTNASDIMFALKEIGLSIYHKSIKLEYAKIIDDYFTRFGYRINLIKIPNITGRPIYNYVQIGSNESIGYSENINYSVTSKSLDIINQIYRSGVTIWHNHANIGNFELDNSLQN